MLKFNKAASKQEIIDIFEHNIDAFTDTPDFNWTLDEIQLEVKDDWELYSVTTRDEIIAALFLKEQQDTLLSKNTAIKINFQGSGFSHQIKEFFEKEAKKRKLKKILHYCRIDNFRMYSLNESHEYSKTKNTLGDGQIIEWEKKLK